MEGIILESRRQKGHDALPGSEYHGGRGDWRPMGQKTAPVSENWLPTPLSQHTTVALGIKTRVFNESTEFQHLCLLCDLVLILCSSRVLELWFLLKNSLIPKDYWEADH